MSIYVVLQLYQDYHQILPDMLYIYLVYPLLNCGGGQIMCSTIKCFVYRYLLIDPLVIVVLGDRRRSDIFNRPTCYCGPWQ